MRYIQKLQWQIGVVICVSTLIIDRFWFFIDFFGGNGEKLPPILIFEDKLNENKKIKIVPSNSK